MYMQSDIIFVEKCECECECECKKVESECDFSLPSHTRIPPKSPLLLSDFAALKVFTLFSFSWLHQTESPALFPYSFPCSLFLSSLLLTWHPPSLTKTKYPSLKKKLKG